ncbi:MAG: glycosyltransferase family 2 protein [Chloroflexi bacterium]|nr:glycosyltransferase family 2 protein [Chloroflexota bacterium]
MYKGKKIGVVTAAYNEEKLIAETVQTIPQFVDRIYVTNDASTDATGRILAGMRDSRLLVMTHAKRSGAGAATLSGYKKACEEGMDVVAVMAGDGQMDPAILGRILDPVVEGKAEYSKGDRLSVPGQSRGMPAWRLFGNSLLTYIIKVASGYWRLVDPLNGYTAITRQALMRIDLDKVEKDYAFETDLLVKLNAANTTVVNVPMPARYRSEKSKITYLRFTTRLSWIIARDYAWRLWTKYLGPKSRRAPEKAEEYIENRSYRRW